MNKIILIFGYSFLPFLTLAQLNSATMANFNRVSNGLDACPAAMPDFHFNVFGPQIEYSELSNFSISQLYSTSQFGGSLLTLNDVLQGSNQSSGDYMPNLLAEASIKHRGIGLGFVFNKLCVYAGTNRNIHLGVGISPGLLADPGRAFFDYNLLNGQPKAFVLNASAYNEKHIGIVIKPGPISLGFRYRFLNGIFNLQTERAYMRLVNNGQPTLLSDLSVYSSNLDAFNLINQPIENIPPMADFFNSTANQGRAMDVGLGLDLGKYIQLQFSATNINASITWKDRIQSYNQSTEELYYNAPFFTPTNNTSPSQLFVGFQDSLRSKLLQQRITNIKDYTTTLPTQFLGTVHISLNRLVQFGAVYQQRSPQASFESLNSLRNFIFYYQSEWGKFLLGRAFIASNSQSSTKGTSFGALLAVRILGVQAFAGLNGLGPSIDRKAFNAQVGASFNLGYRDKSKSQD